MLPPMCTNGCVASLPPATVRFDAAETVVKPVTEIIPAATLLPAPFAVKVLPKLNVPVLVSTAGPVMVTAPLIVPVPPRVVLALTATAPVPVPEPEVLLTNSVPALIAVPPV